MTGNRLHTAAEIAELLGVPERWVRDNSRSGAVPHVRIGKYVRYDRDDVVAWVESLKRGGGPAFRRYRPGVVR